MNKEKIYKRKKRRKDKKKNSMKDTLACPCQKYNIDVEKDYKRKRIQHWH